VHNGWYQAVENIWSDLFAEVSRLSALFPDYQVKVTGHSLGASLAQLTGMRLTQAGVNTYMINFGSPRTGDKDFATFSDKVFK
jgi:triacylglycerol lipase